jgi:hypothetical protein
VVYYMIVEVIKPEIISKKLNPTVRIENDNAIKLPGILPPQEATFAVVVTSSLRRLDIHRVTEIPIIRGEIHIDELGKKRSLIAHVSEEGLDIIDLQQKNNVRRILRFKGKENALTHISSISFV